METILELIGTDELCPVCDEEISLTARPTGGYELTCRCGCSLTAA